MRSHPTPSNQSPKTLLPAGCWKCPPRMWFYGRAEEKGGWMSGGPTRAWKCNITRYPSLCEGGEGIRVRAWSGCQSTWGFYLWFHVQLPCQLFFHLFPFLPILLFFPQSFTFKYGQSVFQSGSLCPCPIPWHHACLFVRVCWSLKIGQPLNNYSDLIFLPAPLFSYCILSENSPQSNTGV